MKQIEAHEPTWNEQRILDAVAEMEGESYQTIADALKMHSAHSILDIWLRYEGIFGYTDSILEVLKAVGYDLD